MYSRLNYRAISLQPKSIVGSMVLLLAALLVPLSSSHAQPVEFEVKPARCIALHQGQTCYQDLELNWRTPPTGDYCLVQLGDAEGSEPSLISCWSGIEKTSHRLEFVSDRNIIYQIRLRDQTTALAQVVVELAWVYKSGSTNYNVWWLF
jgi:hypothetical protein